MILAVSADRRAYWAIHESRLGYDENWMTTFSWPMEIGDLTGQRFERIEALVDTGASFSIVPAHLLEQLSIGVIDRDVFELGDGRTLEMAIGEARVRIDGRTRVDIVAFGPDGVGPMLGAHTLEAFLLAVDPAGKRLVPRRGLLR